MRIPSRAPRERRWEWVGRVPAACSPSASSRATAGSPLSAAARRRTIAMMDFGGELKHIREAAKKRCPRRARLTIEAPASARMLKRQSEKHGVVYPDFLREVLLTVGRTIELTWKLSPDSIEELPRGLRAIRVGNLMLDYRIWVFKWETYGGRRTPPPHMVGWYGKQELQDGFEGGSLALDPSDGGVVWLAPHYDKKNDVARRGESAEIFYRAWLSLACVGPNSAHFRPFLDPAGLLTDESPAAARWRRWFGLA